MGREQKLDLVFVNLNFAASFFYLREFSLLLGPAFEVSPPFLGNPLLTPLGGLHGPRCSLIRHNSRQTVASA
jgi:hypothetical protein